MSATASSPNTVRWDLSALFTGIDDPKIEATWTSILQRADEFAKTYRGKINQSDLSAETLANGIKEIESIYQEAAKPGSFAQLLFAGDSTDPKIGAFMGRQMELGSELSVKTLFFELELQSVDDAVIARIIDQPALANYRHYVQTARKYCPHKLSEPEEVILEETANTGCRAWVRLYEEALATHVFKLLRPGATEPEEMTEEQVMKLLRDSDRGVRQAAADSLSLGLKELQHTIVFIYNTIVQDLKVGDRLRKHPYPEHSRHLANELDKATVDTVIDVCRTNYELVARFYRLKREILGLPELTHIDRYAPLFESNETVDFEQGKEIVLKAFAGFSTEMSNRAAEFFDRKWIDAESRKGKQGGAFCMYCTPDTHPVVFQTYQDHYDDVMTMAHELGHGVHASLSRKQTYLNYQGTLPLAELASTFGEMLVFENIVKGVSDREKLALYAEKIEGIFATVFRQAALYSFEMKAHEARRSQGELTADDYGDLWQEELQAMFGDAVALGEQHRDWWAMIGHFFFAPFYVYAYSFGELLALSIYEKAKQEGPSFEAKYTHLLELGGSRTPQELMATVGVDLSSREFWEGGVAVIEKLVSDFESMWERVR